MDIRKLQRTIVDGLEDVKAQHIAVFNTEHLSALFERVIIASGTSNRQTKALASSVREAVKGAGYPVPRTEGEANGEWIIIDCGAAVVHVMQPMIREYYHLEEIWGDKPVNLKVGASRKLVKASAPADEDVPPAGAARKTSTGRRGAARTALPAIDAAPPVAAKKATARRPAGAGARKAASPGAREPVVTRTVGSKAAATRPDATRKVAIRRGPADGDATARPVAKRARVSAGGSGGSGVEQTPARELVRSRTPTEKVAIGPRPARKVATAVPTSRKPALRKAPVETTASREAAVEAANPRSAPIKTKAPRKMPAKKTAG